MYIVVFILCISLPIDRSYQLNRLTATLSWNEVSNPTHFKGVLSVHLV